MRNNDKEQHWICGRDEREMKQSVKELILK